MLKGAVRRERVLLIAAAIISGVLVVLALPERDAWLLAWFALVPLVLAIERSRSLAFAAALGFVTGLVTNLGGLSWISDLVERFGPVSRPWAIAIYGIYCSYQALVFAGFAWTLSGLRRGLVKAQLSLPLWVLAPVVMVAWELVVPLVFPWNLGMTQASVVPVIQLAELGGPFAITALLLLVTGAICDAVVDERQRVLACVLALGIVSAALLFGRQRIAALEAEDRGAPALRVGIVQGNFSFDRHAAGQRELAAQQLAMLQRMSRELERRGAQLIVWSETAYPYGLATSLERDFGEATPQRIARDLSVPLLFGAPSVEEAAMDGSPIARNSAFMRDAAGRITGRYDKNELVSFGEKIPFDDVIPLLRHLRLSSAGHFVPGREVTMLPLDTAQGRVGVGVLICLEDILPEMGRRVGALAPQLFVNLSNDAWFGPTAEPMQHLALSVFRSVEQRTPLVRAVNGGPSAFVSSTGRVLRHTERASALEDARGPELMLGEVRLREAGHTFYARFGNLFAAACAAFVLLVGLWLVLARRLSSALASKPSRAFGLFSDHR